MPPGESPRRSRLAIGQRWQPFVVLVSALATAVIVCFGIPLAYPALGLDPSWQQALVEATDSSRVFGREVIFNFGPLHQAATDQVSTNLVPLLTGRLVFSVEWTAAVLMAGLLRGLQILAAVAIGQAGSAKPDPMFYSLSSLGVLLSVVHTATETGPRRARTTLMLMVAIGIALSTLVKLSFTAAALPALTCMLSLEFLRLCARPACRPAGALAAMAMIPPAALVAAWTGVSSGGPEDFAPYFTGLNAEIVLGYSVATSAIGPSPQIGLVAVGAYGLASLVSGVLCWLTHLKPLSRTFPTPTLSKLAALVPALTLLVIQWVVLKAGFVRLDGHIVTGTMLCILFPLFVLALGGQDLSSLSSGHRWRLAAPILLFAAGALLILAALHRKLPLHNHGPVTSLLNTPAIAALLLLSAERERILARRGASHRDLRGESEDLWLKDGASADILPWEVTALLANGAPYRPRPVPQSYSAYTRPLQLANAAYFAPPHPPRPAGLPPPPEQVVVSVNDIDGRLPISLDSPAIRTILETHAFSHTGSRGSLVFGPAGHGIPLGPKTVVSGELSWRSTGHGGFSSTPIPLPGQGSIAWLSVDLRATLSRSGASILFRSFPFFFDYLDANGTVVESDRIVPKAVTDLLVFPLIKNNEELLGMVERRTGRQKDPVRHQSQLAAVRFSVNGFVRPFDVSPYRMEVIRR